MSYSDGDVITYSYDHDFGAGDETFRIAGLAGKKGLILDVIVSAYELFTNTTTEADVNIGSAEGGAQYVAMGLGTLADKAVQQVRDTAADLVLDDLPADTDIWVEFEAPTGGTPAGKAHVHIVILWY